MLVHLSGLFHSWFVDGLVLGGENRGVTSTYIIPQTHDENHGRRQRSSHLGQTTLVVERVGITERLLLRITVPLRDGVPTDARHIRLRVGDNLAVLHVEALNLGQGATATCEELGHDGDLLGGIDDKVGSRAVKGRVALAVAVEVATVGITVAGVPVAGVGAAAGVGFALVLGAVGAWVRSEGRGDVVGFPDVHFGAAGAQVADAGVDVVLGRHPAFGVGLDCKIVSVYVFLKDSLRTSSFQLRSTPG